ncbi:MAG: hypothetical protein COW65_17120 [Cytophagales bacterium CG18_big_fil_WC_8_21_14_2_50_42_9]|nr:MAG: hypothetical protein COW65_17120 [Cytophagales bacterium CG18_big_fil_WC_8_21_14_2_50_42_9]
MDTKLNKLFFERIRHLLMQARAGSVKQVNYFEMGKQMVEQEQKGQQDAEYGTYILSELSRYLTAELGKGFSKGSLELIRRFYTV